MNVVVLLFPQHFIMAVLKYGGMFKAQWTSATQDTVTLRAASTFSLRLFSPQIIKQLRVVSNFPWKLVIFYCNSNKVASALCHLRIV